MKGGTGGVPTRNNDEKTFALKVRKVEHQSVQLSTSQSLYLLHFLTTFGYETTTRKLQVRCFLFIPVSITAVKAVFRSCVIVGQQAVFVIGYEVQA